MTDEKLRAQLAEIEARYGAQEREIGEAERQIGQLHQLRDAMVMELNVIRGEHRAVSRLLAPEPTPDAGEPGPSE